MEPSFFEESVEFFPSCVGEVQNVGENIAERWLDMLNKRIEDLKSSIEDSSIVYYSRKKFQTCHEQLISIRAQISSGLHRGGNVIPQETPKVTWEDGKSAFKNCIRSEIITNLSHIDISSFLNDTFLIFEKKLNCHFMNWIHCT